MPIYEYECDECKEVVEAMQSFSDEPLTDCPSCSGTLHKLISRSSFHLKGGGWYSDGYNVLEPAPQVVFRCRVELPFETATLLFPYAGTAPPAAEIRSVSGGYEVSINGTRDVLGRDELARFEAGSGSSTQSPESAE